MEKFKEILAKDEKELTEQVDLLSKEALNLRFQQASGSLKNTARMRHIRREVAKIKTALSQKNAAKKSA